jgi:hypothetical protein
LAIIIPNYYPIELCLRATILLSKNKIEHYQNAPSIGRYGMAFYETENNQRKIDLYYHTAISNIQKVRKIFCPNLSPIDKFKLDLEECWIPGATIQNIHDKKMFVGLCRLLEPNIDFLPHQDIFCLDAIDNDMAKKLLSQLALNIYLTMPDKGGEVELWNFGFSKDDYLKKLDQGSYGIKRSKLPEPFIKIKPHQGDLVLFNSQLLHAIRPGSSTRISISCFVGYSGMNEPLKYWS